MGGALYILISASAISPIFDMVKSNIVILPGRKINNLSQYSPLIFIGGVPRSGTTLIRAMLDAHPAVRCGEETRIIPRILGLRTQWKKSQKEWNRLKEAGVTDEVINDAISSFILQVIAGHGEPAERLCNKDPFTMKSAEYLAQLFPNSKFLLMIRDGRATVHSIISRQVTITGFDLNDPRQCLDKWNRAIKIMYEQCKAVGRKRCLMVYYEQLVLHPEQQLRRILSFLDVPWNDRVLHHDKLIGKDISLSKVERSTDQVIKPVNLDALTKWVGTFSEDIIQEMASLAPMLAELGYDPNANPPKYGEPDPIVLKNTDELHMNMKEWERRAKEVVAPAVIAVPAPPLAR
uniref:Protein-tyrosine sulfotransferase n=1 Tax=Setaria digitata TaxID=48799 RepID=A0A915PID0_9BILA